MMLVAMLFCCLTLLLWLLLRWLPYVGDVLAIDVVEVAVVVIVCGCCVVGDVFLGGEG